MNVVPKSLEKDNQINEKIGYSNKDKIAKVPDEAIEALTTPLSLTGTPEEIDAELAKALRGFAESHVQVQKTVDQAKEQIADAVKAIEERDKNKGKAKAVHRSTPEESVAPGKTASAEPSLFDTSGPAAAEDTSAIVGT